MAKIKRDGGSSVADSLMSRKGESTDQASAASQPENNDPDVRSLPQGSKGLAFTNKRSKVERKSKVYGTPPIGKVAGGGGRAKKKTGLATYGSQIK